MDGGTVLGAWSHACGGGLPEQAWIPPDGCQDLVGIALPGGPAEWHIYATSSCADTVTLPPGARLRGYRLAPGTLVDAQALLRQARRLDLEDGARALDLLAQHTRQDARVEEALQALAQTPSVAQAASALGVGPRTLERLLQRHTGKPPVFWRALARVRQAARRLDRDRAWPLPEVAAAHGYADQAHMNLEFRRWLGCTPGQLRRDAQRLHLLAQSGYG